MLVFNGMRGTICWHDAVAGSDISVVVAEALYHPVRELNVATHFRRKVRVCGLTVGTAMRQGKVHPYTCSS